jgi:Na+-translocating ferredoxin:NAD+ oxidoreductase RNF subunit RnfB
MDTDVYRRLARRLNAIPNGFPSTASGVELRLLARIFAPDEANLAAVLRLTHEPVAAIAGRAGVDTEDASSLLKRMARHGLIRSSKQGDERLYGLMPFMVGVYEEQMPRIDEETAALFEEYFRETGGTGMIAQKPALHRVIPVDETIRFGIEVFPYERASELIENAKAWGLRKCICRVQRGLLGKACEHEVENCILFAPVEGAFDGSEITRPVTKAEALKALLDAEEAGLVHTTQNHGEHPPYICNCCACCCGILRGLTEFGNPASVARSDFQAVVDGDACTGCGTCIERCYFGALAVSEDLCRADPSRCLGCGLCIAACPADALRLERRPDDERTSVPENEQEWMKQRARERGIDLAEIA